MRIYRSPYTEASLFIVQGHTFYFNGFLPTKVLKSQRGQETVSGTLRSSEKGSRISFSGRLSCRQHKTVIAFSCALTV